MKSGFIEKHPFTHLLCLCFPTKTNNIFLLLMVQSLPHGLGEGQARVGDGGE